MGIRDWTSDTWTAIATVVAFAALIQPWATALWKKLFKRGSVEIYETSPFEIGFSGFGPTIAVTGTLRARDQDMFIPVIRMSLHANRTNGLRVFEWAGFRNAKALFGTAVGQSTEVAFEAPSGFMVSTAQPYRYNIIFAEIQALEQLRPIFESYRTAWLDYFLKESRLNPNTLASDPAAQAKVVNEMRRVHQKFQATEPYKRAFEALDRIFSWTPDTYSVLFEVITAGPNRKYPESWTFSLTQQDVDNLRNNVGSILEELVQLPLSTGMYFFAYPPYTSSQ